MGCQNAGNQKKKIRIKTGGKPAVIISSLACHTMQTFDCCDPWFSHLKEGRKVVEGRLNTNKYKDLVIGSIIKLYKPDDENEFILLKIVNIVKYESFRKMLEVETLERVLPDENVKSIEDGVAIYREFYSEKLEKSKGVIAIYVDLIKIH